jgi:esterase
MELFFRKEGTEEPLVILHGLFGSSDNWMSIAKKLAKKYAVFMPDLRNHGHSPHNNSHSYEDLKNDLVEFMDSHNIHKTTLLGHSMGGKIAMYFAADYPERVTRLIVVDIVPKNYTGFSETSQIKSHLDIMTAMLEVDFKSVRSRDEIDGFLSKKIPDPGTRQFLLKNIDKDKNTGMFKWRININTLYNFRDEIVSGVSKKWLEDRIPITAYPVVFIKGENSDYILPGDEILIKEIYPEARIVKIPDAGHWLHAEQPDLLVKAVLEFS